MKKILIIFSFFFLFSCSSEVEKISFLENEISPGVLRTPEERFANLEDYPYEPNYMIIDGLRIHYLDEGPKDADPIFLLHGEPTWSYLFRKMIPVLVNEGHRVIVPDCVGFGKSDKFISKYDYSYKHHVEVMIELIERLDLKNTTFFGQDWGGLIGLRVVTNEPDRFLKVAMGNTGLPYNPDTPQEVIDKVKAFRESDRKLTVISMQKEVSQMDGKNLVDDKTSTSPALKFMYWQKFCWETEDLPIGFLMSNMMEKNSTLKTIISYLFLRLGLRKLIPLNKVIDHAYEAPFPDPSFKMGPRAMPSHVPTIPDQSLSAVREAREIFKNWNKPFLSVFAGDDPVTNGAERDVLNMCPNAKSAPQIGGGHFYQWTRPKELSNLLANFIKEND